MFRVKVRGTYVARSANINGEKIKKDYEIEGCIPTIKAALSVVKNYLLEPALKAKYGDYVTYLTYHIIEITPLDQKSVDEMGKMEINFMDRPMLIKYIKENAIGVFMAEKDEDKDFENPKGLDHRYFPDLFKLRAAVEHAKEDAKGFNRWFFNHKEELAMALQMASANPGLFHVEQPNAAGFIASISPDALQKPKALSSTAHVKQTGDRMAGLAADQIRDGEMAPLDASAGETSPEDL